jgi:hypothetical protein
MGVPGRKFDDSSAVTYRSRTSNTGVLPRKYRKSLRTQDYANLGIFCNAKTLSGNPCKRVAGLGTEHYGLGYCVLHREQETRVWNMAHAITFVRKGEIGINILLEEIARTAGEVDFLGSKVGEAPDDAALLPGGQYFPWLVQWRDMREHLLRSITVMLRSQVEDKLATQAERDGAMIASVLNNTLVEMQLPPVLMDDAREILRRQLLELESGQ